MRKLSRNTGPGMSRQSKTAPQAKKVLPPAVPDIYGKVGPNNGAPMAERVGGVENLDSSLSSESAGVTYAEVCSGGHTKAGGITAVESQNHGGVGGGGGCTAGSNSAGSTMSAQAIVTGATAPSSLLLRCGADVVADYVMDDQGIDLTQSPGRDSPVSLSGSAGSGSRHSTASLDSGRASSYLTGASNSSNRSVSGVGSYGVLSSPRCSVSSCSIGSGSGTGGGNSSSGNSSGGGGGGNPSCGAVGVISSHRLSNHSAGRCDHDNIFEWLMEVHFQEYTFLFLDAGYDLPTIARMTPEDLTAIGIRKPYHRELLKRHIDALKLPDPLPGYVPGSIEEWLHLLRLDEYIQPLLAQGYQTVHDVTQLTWEDLEDIGIVKLGHQKKILLAIKRVKDIINGKMMGGGGGGGGVVGGSTLAAFNVRASPTVAARSVPGIPPVRAHYDDMSIGLRSDFARKHQMQQYLPVVIPPRGSYSTFLRQQPPLSRFAGVPYSGVNATLFGLPRQAIVYPHVHFNGTQAVYRRSSYDDSDITPTNERASAVMVMHGGGGAIQQQAPQLWISQHTHQPQQQQQLQQQQQQYFQGGGTLPRQHQRNNYGARQTLLSGIPNQGAIHLQRPVAKVTGNNLKLIGLNANPMACPTNQPVVMACPTTQPVVMNRGAGGGGSGAAISGGGGGGGSGAASGAGSSPVYPTDGVPLPPKLGQIGNVEMATAALDAMHFSNYTSSPYAAAVQLHQQQTNQQLQHHTPMNYGVGGGGDGGSNKTTNDPSDSSISSANMSGYPAAAANTSMGPQNIGELLNSPIYRNVVALQQLQNQQYTHAASLSSSQSTPSPPTLLPSGGGGGGMAVGGGCGVGVDGQHSQHHPLMPFGSGTYAGQMHQTTVEVHKASSQHDNKSNSSLESIDQIPFANENAGTIKQRSSLNRIEQQYQQQQQHPHHGTTALLLPPTPLSSSSTSSSLSSLAGSLITTNTHAMSPSATDSTASLVTTTATATTIINASNGTNSPGGGPSSSSPVATINPSGNTHPLEQALFGVNIAQGRRAPSSDDIYGTNVLNDIGHMLANLTDELDAMLEDEKCAGISDVE